MQIQVSAGEVIVMVKVVDPATIETRGAADQTVDFVAFVQELLSHIGAILTGYTGDKGTLRLSHVSSKHINSSLNKVSRSLSVPVLS
jgi:hypothetical protein